MDRKILGFTYTAGVQFDKDSATQQILVDVPVILSPYQQALSKYEWGAEIYLSGMRATHYLKGSLGKTYIPEIYPEDGTNTRLNKIMDSEQQNFIQLEINRINGDKTFRLARIPFQYVGREVQKELLTPYLTSDRLKGLNVSDQIRLTLIDSGWGLIKSDPDYIQIEADLLIEISGPKKESVPVSSRVFSQAVTTSGNLIAPANPARVALFVVNEGANDIVFSYSSLPVIGQAPTLSAGGSSWNNEGLHIIKDAFYARAKANTSLVTGIEIFEV